MSAPTSPAGTSANLKDLAKAVTDLGTAVAKIKDRLDEGDKANEIARRGAPFIRQGESALTSRGFQFSRVIGVATEKLNANQAKVEIELSKRLQKEYVERGFYRKEQANSIVVPLSSDLMFEADPTFEKFSAEIKEIVTAGVSGADRDEMGSVVRKVYGGQRRKTLGWQDAGNMGDLIPPPVFGEPIELLRNQEVFLAAGAGLIPFPASGRAVWPRFTGATTGYWLGTGVNDRTMTESEPTTSDLVLQVKKLGVLVQIPNELFRFPSVSVEALVRADMMTTAALKMDKAFLEGVGSALQPRGIITYDNINAYIPGDVGVNGNRLEPEDILQIMAMVEEQNLDFKTWVGRAKLYAGLGNKRADAAAPGDRKGQFLFNILRDVNSQSNDPTQPGKGMLEGATFFKSNQIGKDRTKGTSTDLTYLLGGDFTKYMVAMSGVMEFAVATQGTIFRADQSEIRLITWCDGAPRYEEAFVWVDKLYQTA